MRSTNLYIIMLAIFVILCMTVDNKGLVSLTLSRNAIQVIVVYSVGLVIFPVMAVPLLNSIILNIEKIIGSRLNKELVKDFNDSSFLVSIVSTIEILLIIIWVFTDGSKILDYIILGNLLSLAILFFMLIASMWTLINNYYEAKYGD